MVETNVKKSTHRGVTIIKRLLVSILIFVLMDILAGLIVIKDGYSSFRTQHYYYHHGLLPNQATMAAWGSLVYPFYTNSLGFVDSSVYKVPLKSEKPRIVILGDSHSEGVGVPYLKTFAGRMAKSLEKDGVEILNASCISYSQKTEYLKAKYIIEQQKLEFDHLFILVDISDMQNELVYEHFYPARNTFFRKTGIRIKSVLKKHSAIYFLLNNYISSRRTRKFFETAQLFEDTNKSEESNSLELYSTFFSDFNDKTLLSNPQFHGVGEWYYDDYFRSLADRGIDMAQDYMLKLKELCDSNDIGLTISVHPWQMQIWKGDTTDYYTDRWKVFCEDNNIDFVNLFPLFISEENPVITNKRYYIADDNHWNEFGHERVATYLDQYFRENLIEP